MINKILKKLRLKFCCYSKCGINDDYEDRNNENYIVDRVKISSFV